MKEHFKTEHYKRYAKYTAQKFIECHEKTIADNPDDELLLAYYERSKYIVDQVLSGEIQPPSKALDGYSSHFSDDKILYENGIWRYKDLSNAFSVFKSGLETPDENEFINFYCVWTGMNPETFEHDRPAKECESPDYDRVLPIYAKKLNMEYHRALKNNTTEPVLSASYERVKDILERMINHSEKPVSQSIRDAIRKELGGIDPPYRHHVELVDAYNQLICTLADYEKETLENQ